MKRWIVILVALAMAALGGAALCKVFSHRVVKSELSDVYLRYKDRDDIHTGFIKDYRIDDSTTVDVTTLTARDSASWEALLREMKMKESEIKRMRDAVNDGNYPMTEYSCKKNYPEQRIPPKEGESWLVIIMHTEKTFFIFHIIDNEQSRIIRHKKMRETFNNSKNNKI
ncbi:MAG: hypothetical protein J6T88_08550 [Bacteroidales bacterium]|nr:hypothetical protein [Bacteroidales bacterium]